MKWCPSLLALAFFLYFYNTQNLVSAQYFTGTVAQSLGGSGRAGAEEGEETFLNPAALAHANSYAADLVYGDDNRFKGESGYFWAISFSDNNQDVFFPGALQFVKKLRSFEGLPSVEETFWQLSTGNFYFKQLAIGLSLYRLQLEVAQSEGHTFWDGVIGFNYNPAGDFAVALVFYNVFGSPEAVPEHLRQPQSIMAGGTYLVTDFVRVRLDMGRQVQLNPDTEWKIQGGLESFLNDFIVLRFGWDSDPARDYQGATIGLSFNGPRLKMDYAFVENSSSGGGQLHSVDLRIPF
ncbi:hypothetical protein OAQ84_01440 [Bdellovibrionales bacterium]|nr:hypothetical protein [Bdellovibrionales bacterium]